LVKIVPIKGTGLFTGLAYRLHHELFGKAPIVTFEIPKALEVRAARGPWLNLPYGIVAERNPTEWHNYE